MIVVQTQRQNSSAPFDRLGVAKKVEEAGPRKGPPAEPMLPVCLGVNTFESSPGRVSRGFRSVGPCPKGPKEESGGDLAGEPHPFPGGPPNPVDICLPPERAMPNKKNQKKKGL